MMELKYFALVLLVQTSFVISTPYGYGPRTGVSAKAEANAVAGAFGGPGSVPTDIPSGAGYSGSFSKASSSSFASSSASSSASASSYSYGGSGLGGSAIGGEGNPGCGSEGCKFGVKGGNQGLSGSGSRAFSSSNAGSVAGFGGAGTGSTYNKGGSLNEPKTSDCGSGNCQLSGSKDLGSYGSTISPNAYSSSNSLFGTGSSNLPTPKCEGSDCDNASDANDKCASGQCAQDDNTEGGSNANVKCTSGNCGAMPQSAATSSYGSNNKCESGQCESNTPSGSAKDYNSNDIHVPTGSGISNANTNYGSNIPTLDTNSNSGCKYGNCDASPASKQPSYTPEYPPCSSPNCNDYGLGPTSAPSSQDYGNKPAILLTTPKEDSQCTTPNCQPLSVHGKLPSANGYSLGYGAQSQNVFTNPSTSPCAGGGNCNYGQTKAPYSTNLINSDNQPLSPSSTYPSTQRPSGYGASSASKPYHHVSETQFSMQPYGTSCAPGSPNCGGITPSYVASCAPGSPSCGTGAVNPSFPTKVTPSFGPSCAPGTPGCTPGYVTPIGLNCAPGSPGCNAAAAGTPFGPSCAPGSPGCKPDAVASFGPSCAPGSPSCNAGPIIPGYAKPMQGLMPPFSPSAAENSFSGSTSGSGHYSGGSYGRRPSGGSYGSRPSAGSYGFSPSHASLPAQFPPSQNGNSYSGTGSLPSSPYAPTGYQSGHTGSGSTPTIPSYNIPSSGFPSSSVQNSIATPTYTAPTGGICNTPNCGGSGNLGVSSGVNAQSKPLGASSSNDELPTYSGGFGGPSGILKPNEFKAPSAPYKPAISSHTPETGNPQGAPCVNGNCGFHALASPSYGNSGSYPGGQSADGTGANVGFGGAAGILKPNDFTAPSSTYNKPATSGFNPACSTGTCGLSVPSGSNVHGGSGSQVTASASASANAVAYTGGFGGPPGFLKPYDGGKSELSTGKLQSGHYGSHQGVTGNGAYLTTHNGETGSQPIGIQGSSVAQAKAVASASSGANTAGGYNHGGHKTGGSGDCGGGCGAPGSVSFGDGTNGGFGHSKSGGLDGSNGGLNAAGANAKSTAGAVGGSGAFSSSYASSSASAHATSGAAVKGSYGK